MKKDPDTGFIALSALRYAMGRKTVAPEITSEWIKRHWKTFKQSD